MEIWNNLRDTHSQGNGPKVFELQKDIASINQGDSSITAYFTQWKLYWNQLKNFRPTLTCSCGKCTCNLLQRIENVHLQDSVMQFLMGLNDSYSQIKGHILLMEPLPSINKAYSLLIQEERQRRVGSSNAYIESTALAVKSSNATSSFFLGVRILRARIGLSVIIVGNLVILWRSASNCMDSLLVSSLKERLQW